MIDLEDVTVDDCKEKCSADNLCKSFDYGKENLICRLSTKNSQDGDVIFGTNNMADTEMAEKVDWSAYDYYEKVSGIFQQHNLSNVSF